GFLAKDAVTLHSALWKAGKTTLLGPLLRHLGAGGTFLGQAVSPAKVLYVSEESSGLWAERRDRLQWGDWVHFILQPFLATPTPERCQQFLEHLNTKAGQLEASVIVLDPLSALWPVTKENDAAEVRAACLPLRKLAKGRSILLVHHLRKNDGQEATAARGSGALTAFADILLELRRYNAGDLTCRRRTIRGYSRYNCTPAEVVIELNEEGTDYSTHGTKEATQNDAIKQAILGTLPSEPPGQTVEEILAEWPDDDKPSHTNLYQVLKKGL